MILSTRWTRIALAVAAFASPLAAAAQAPGAKAGDLIVRVGGKPSTIKRATLDSLPQRTIRLPAGPDSGEVSGIDLWEILQRAHAVSDQASGRQRAVMYLRVTAGLEAQRRGAGRLRGSVAPHPAGRHPARTLDPQRRLDLGRKPPVGAAG